MNATFIAGGKGIETGKKIDTVRNIDVAPTIAHLMGLKLDQPEGRVLTEILTN
jgi:hypothetical protein